MLETKTQFSLKASHLKWIAIITMFLNHLCYALSYQVGVRNYFVVDAHWYLTRIAFVIFCFQIAEGMHYTRNRKKYILSLFAFALISEIPFNLFFGREVFYSSGQNVFFTLAFGALSIALIDSLDRKPVYGIPIALLTMAICVFVASDYLFVGEALILAFYYFREDKKKQLLVSAVVFTVFTFLFFLHRDVGSLDWQTIRDNERLWVVIGQELHGLLAWPLLALYHGEKGKNINKWFFYAFYPVHLLLLHLLVLVLT